MHVEINDAVQQFRFYLDKDEYYVYSGGLELLMDKQMNICYCDMPENWKQKAVEKLQSLIKVEKLNKTNLKHVQRMCFLNR